AGLVPALEGFAPGGYDRVEVVRRPEATHPVDAERAVSDAVRTDHGGPERHGFQCRQVEALLRIRNQHGDRCSSHQSEHVGARRASVDDLRSNAGAQLTENLVAKLGLLVREHQEVEITNAVSLESREVAEVDGIRDGEDRSPDATGPRKRLGDLRADADP